MFSKLYKYIFWAGYTAVLITSVLKINWSLNKVHVNLITFDLRLDHLLHLTAYFLICMYYLAGRLKGFALFESNSLRKFILVTVLLGTVTEFVQLWVPERAFNVLDWVANLSGIGLGLIVIIILESRRTR